MDRLARRNKPPLWKTTPPLALRPLPKWRSSSSAPPTEKRVAFHVSGNGRTSPQAFVIDHLLKTCEGMVQVHMDLDTGYGELRCVRVPPLPVVQQIFQAHGYTILPYKQTPRFPARPETVPPSASSPQVPFPLQGLNNAGCVARIDCQLQTLAGGPQGWVDARTGSGVLLSPPGASVPPFHQVQNLLPTDGSLIVPHGDTLSLPSETSSPARKQRSNPLALGINQVSPSWFTSVMGTGILAVCLTISPVSLPFFAPVALGLMIGDAVLLGLLLCLLLLQGLFSPTRMAVSFQDGAQAQLWGAPPVACFTVATGFLLIGSHVLSPTIVLPCAQGLWLLGVAGSLGAALVVPYRMMTCHDLTTASTSGSWLMPVAALIVAPASGALLAAHWPLALRSDMLALSYALWGMGVALSSLLIVLVYARLIYHHIPAGPLIPTLWIVVGPVGQSIASLNALGNVSPVLWPTVGPALHAAALLYGFPVWGFGVYWLVLALVVTVRAAFRRLPFTLGWWAFVFPVGTLTAGTAGLYTRTHIPLFAGSGVLLLGLLTLMWTLVVTRTLGHLGNALKRGTSNVTT